MKFTEKQYTFRVIFETDEGGYHAYVPVLAGCHTWGRTLKEVRTNVREAIKSHIGSLIKDGQQVPKEAGFEAFETFSAHELQGART